MQYDPTTTMPAKSPAGGDIAKWIDGVKSEKKCRQLTGQVPTFSARA